MPDRYKPMGLEMLPSEHFDVLANPDTEGMAWVYGTEHGAAVVAFNEASVLKVTGKGLSDLEDGALADRILDVVLESAEAGKSIEKAKTEVKKRFGNPAFVVPLKSINDPEPDVRPAIEAQI